MTDQLPAALVTPAFGNFLDRRESAPITAPAAKHVLALLDIMSKKPSQTMPAMMDRLGDEIMSYLGQTKLRHKLSLSQGPSQNTKLIKLQKQDGSTSKACIVILEGMTERPPGSDPAEKLRERYTQAIQSLPYYCARLNISLPAAGVEVVGTDLRFHALWYQGGHVCSEPLTTAHHFIDLRVSNPAYMEGLVKMVTAFGQLVADLSDSMAPCVEA